MKIKWLAHSFFLITSDSGVKILTDPYTLRPDIKHASIKEVTDIVTISHGHSDHNGISGLPGKFEVINSTGTFKIRGIEIKGIPAYHDEESGVKRGGNIIFCLEVDGIKICHLGDIGHKLSSGQKKEIGKVDILCVPVGGNYTVDARLATLICSDLNPCITIPMHFKTSKLGFPIATVDDFIKEKNNVKVSGDSELEINKNEIPSQMQILVLQPAL
jgi:L-ascorbate metabolism protein UlaG (beta-lactamase superfamily)